jgi:hypothetical protein
MDSDGAHQRCRLNRRVDKQLLPRLEIHPHPHGNFREAVKMRFKGGWNVHHVSANQSGRAAGGALRFNLFL